MDPLLKCLLDLCWHVAFLFYQVSTWNWTLLLVIYNVDTLCRDKQEGILRNELNAFLFFFQKNPISGQHKEMCKKFLTEENPVPEVISLMIYTKTRGNPRQGSRFGIPVYQPPQECRLHSLKYPAPSSSRSSKSRQSKLVVYLKIVYISVSIKCCTRADCLFFVVVTRL